MDGWGEGRDLRIYVDVKKNLENKVGGAGKCQRHAEMNGGRNVKMNLLWCFVVIECNRRRDVQ